MKTELYMISAHEEYTNKHICRRHWNYNWRGRRGADLTPNKNVKIRKESFGGLMQTSDGQIWKLDNEAYFWLDLIFSNN